jgi:hypothetical protein
MLVDGCGWCKVTWRKCEGLVNYIPYFILFYPIFIYLKIINKSIYSFLFIRSNNTCLLI